MTANTRARMVNGKAMMVMMNCEGVKSEIRSMSKVRGLNA